MSRSLARDYEQIDAEKFGLQVSQQNILLQASHRPEKYKIGLLDESQTVDIRLQTDLLIVNPGRISLTSSNSVVEVSVEIIQNTEQEAFAIYHLIEEQKVYFVVNVYLLKPDGVNIMSAGYDSQFQLGHAQSLQKFHEQLQQFVEFSIVDTTTSPLVLCPMPDKIYDNDQILLLKSQSECYLEYPYWKAVAQGDHHTLAITTDGRLYSWGTGLFGQLGFTIEQIQELQDPIVNPPNRKLLVPAKKFHLEYQNITSIQQLINKSQVPYRPVIAKPLQIQQFNNVIGIACGLYHSLVLTSDNLVYSFGLGNDGRLGHETYDNQATPQLIQALTKLKIIEVGAGYHTSFFLTDQHELLSCGSYSEGALGHSQSQQIPKKISFLNQVKQFHSGFNHTGVVTRSQKVILFGNNDYNKLGGPSPCKIDIPEAARSVHCGGNHTIILTTSFQLYSLGCNQYGQLGLSSTLFQSMKYPTKIEYLSNRGVCNISVGFDHSCATTVDGLLYCWGSNKYGQLAIGTSAKEFQRVGLPRLIDHILGQPVSFVQCGRRNTAFITADSHFEKYSTVFDMWKKQLLIQERHMQELANYRFSLLICNQKKALLVQKVNQQRDEMYKSDILNKTAPVYKQAPLQNSQTVYDRMRISQIPRKRLFGLGRRKRKSQTVRRFNRSSIQFHDDM